MTTAHSSILSRVVFAAAVLLGQSGLVACVAPVDESDGERAGEAVATFHIKPGEAVFDGALKGIRPGDQLCLDAGTHGSLTIRNVRGIAGAPVVITNCGGKAKIVATHTAFSLKVERSSFFKLTGRGGGGTYGIEIDGQQSLTSPAKPGLMGVSVGLESTELEIESLDIHHIGFAGIMAKSEPGCANDSVSPKRFILDPVKKISRDTFVQRHTHIHHNRVHDIARGEGLYIGHSYFGGWYDSNTSHSCYGWTMYPSTLEDVLIEYNEVINTGAEGIQLGCATKNGEVANNLLRHTGHRPFDGRADQDNGIQIGAGTEGKVHHNRVFDVKDAGIMLFGLGKTAVYNNLVVNTGGSGLFADDREGTVVNGEIDIINNTFVNNGGAAVNLYSDISIYNVWNNLIVQPGSLATKGASAYVSRLGASVDVFYGPGNATAPGSNVFVPTIAGARFVDVARENYDLVTGAPAINAGVDVSTRGIINDILGRARPAGGKFDAGAYEAGSTTTTPPPPPPTTSTNVVTSFTVINAVTDAPITTLKDGATLSFAALGTNKLAIRADVGTGVKSIVFGLDGNSRFRVESSAPFSLNGDSTGDYAQWTPTTGAHTVTATPYTATGGTGTAGTPLTVKFTIAP